jgi:integrating conjugative element protein (TIGR03761 family)
MNAHEDRMPKRTLPFNADPAVGYQTAATRPGELRGVADLYVQTRQAQRLVMGRAANGDQPAIIGLVRFGMRVRQLWSASAADDPYADWFLLQTLENLESGREELGRMHVELEALLQGILGVDIAVAESLKPARVPLQFANPYGYMGAYLIADYDRFVRAVLTARHVGLLDRDGSERRLSQGGRLVRRAFASLQRYKHCAVTRDDMAGNTARAREALAAMGPLPAEVLKGDLRPRIAPELPRPARRWSGPKTVGADVSGPGQPPSPVHADPVARDAGFGG